MDLHVNCVPLYKNLSLNANGEGRYISSSREESKGKSKAILVHYRKGMWVGVEVQPHSFLTSVSEGREYSTSQVGQLNPRKKPMEPMGVAECAAKPV